MGVAGIGATAGGGAPGADAAGAIGDVDGRGANGGCWPPAGRAMGAIDDGRANGAGMLVPGVCD